MATNRHRLLVSFKPEEWTQVKALSAQVRLNVSELLRRLVLGYHIPDASEFQGAEAIRDLQAVNADQARLGNLLLLALDVGDQDFTPPMIARIEDLVAEIRKGQDGLRAKIEDLHFQVYPRRKRRA